MSSYTVTKLTTLENINVISDEWHVLAEQMGSPLLDFPWSWAALTELHAEDTPYIVTLRREGRLVGLAPLVKVKMGISFRLEILGTHILAEPAGFLFTDEDAFLKLCEILKQETYPAALFRVDHDSRFYDILRKITSTRCMFSVRPGTATPWADISHGYDSYFSKRSKKRHYDIRRAERRLQEFGEIAVHVFCPSPVELPDVLNSLLKVESRGWKGKKGSSILSRPPLKRFFCAYCLLAAEGEFLSLNTLTLDGDIVAMHIAVIFDKRYWLLKIGYDERYSRASPGIYLLQKSIEMASKQGLVSYEFLGFEDSWLSPWCDGVRHKDMVLTYPNSVSGIYRLLCDGAYYLKRRILRGL